MADKFIARMRAKYADDPERCEPFDHDAAFIDEHGLAAFQTACHQKHERVMYELLADVWGGHPTFLMAREMHQWVQSNRV